MTIASRVVAPVSLILLSLSGCVTPPKDVTRTPEVQSLGIVGRCLMLNRDAPLCRLGRPFPRLVIEGCRTIRAQGGPGKRVAVLPAGTRLTIEKVFDAVSYNDGLFQDWNRHHFGRIHSGPLTGRLVDLGWVGTPASLDELASDLYAPCATTP